MLNERVGATEEAILELDQALQEQQQQQQEASKSAAADVPVDGKVCGFFRMDSSVTDAGEEMQKHCACECVC